jgi:AcrR family transcriptional regulator
MAGQAASVPGKARPEFGAGREALLDAAIRVVARRGLRYLTYRAVAAEAGVTHGLVAHHFGSRDALLLAALRHSVERSIDVTSLRPAGGSVADFIQGFADMVERDPDLHAFQYEVLLESRRSREARRHAEELYATYRSATRDGLRNLGIGDGPLADLAFAALDGLVFQQITVGSANVTRDAVEALHRLLSAVRDGTPLDEPPYSSGSDAQANRDSANA